MLETKPRPTPSRTRAVPRLRPEDAEALIEEARRRQRKRRIFCAAAALVVSAGVVAGYFSYEAWNASPSPRSGSFGRAAATATGALAPVRPGPLAVVRPGILIADAALNRILLRRPAGTFEAFAGTGRRGFSGDGGAAVKADLNDPRGMVVRKDGTIFFADRGNNRVRAISPNGIVRTVAGDGKFGWTASGTPALQAHLGGPEAVAIGPDGELYIAAAGSNEIVRLDRRGVLFKIAGLRTAAGLHGLGGPAVNASPDGPNGLAFDAAGDLYISGGNTKALLEISKSGTMRLPDARHGFYPRGSGGLAKGPDGQVLAIDSQRVALLSPTGVRTYVGFGRSSAGIEGFQPNGFAVGADGRVYVDTWAGNGFARASALLEVRPGHAPRLLWKR